MTSLQLQILQKIERREWVFDLLLLPFKRALERQNRVNSDSQSELELTLKRYLSIQLISEKHQSIFFEPVSFQNPEDLLKLAQAVHPSARIEQWTDSEQKRIVSARKQLSALEQEAGQLVEEIFSKFVRMKDGQFAGASMPTAFGAYFAGDQFFQLSLSEQMISLVHELAHHELFLINLVDRLVLEEADFNMSFAPFQGKVRPPMGRLHSLYALFRMLQYSKSLGGDSSFFEDKLDQTVKSLSASDLSPFGLALIRSIRS